MKKIIHVFLFKMMTIDYPHSAIVSLSDTDENQQIHKGYECWIWNILWKRIIEFLLLLLIYYYKSFNF